jgi:hypothetical protein
MTADSVAGARQDHLDLVNRYCHALDSRDWDLLASLFTEDVHFAARQLLKGGCPGPDDVNLDGRESMIAMLRAIWDHLSMTHHMVTNHVIDLAADGTAAKGSCYLRAYHAGEGATSHLFEESLGRFDFETVRTGGGWKIRRWEENLMIMLGTREVFGPGV